MKAQLTTLLDFLHIAEKLKCELRHSWLSDGRQESVAEHSWRMALMVMFLAPHLKQPVDLEKSLKMAIIHDLAEARAGDIPVFECQTQDAKRQKQMAEKQAMDEIKAILNSPTGDELYALWHEFEDKQTLEAKFVTALDKLEVFIQHNEASLETWLHKEKLMIFQPKWKDQHCQYDETLALLNELVNEDAIEKLRTNGDDVDELRKEAVEELQPV